MTQNLFRPEAVNHSLRRLQGQVSVRIKPARAVLLLTLSGFLLLFCLILVRVQWAYSKSIPCSIFYDPVGERATSGRISQDAVKADTQKYTEIYALISAQVDISPYDASLLRASSRAKITIQGHLASKTAFEGTIEGINVDHNYMAKSPDGKLYERASIIVRVKNLSLSNQSPTSYVGLPALISLEFRRASIAQTILLNAA